MFCTKCGHENAEPAKFCIGCGAPLEAPVTETVQEPVVEAVQEPEVQTETVQEPAVEAVQEPEVQVETVQAPDCSAAPPVVQPQEVTAPPTTYYQPYQQPQQPTAPNAPHWQPPTMPTTGEKPVSLGKWMGVMALEYLLNIVHFIMLFVWGFSGDSEESLKNYARARLIWVAIRAVLVTLILTLTFTIFGFGLMELIDEFMYY